MQMAQLSPGALSISGAAAVLIGSSSSSSSASELRRSFSCSVAAVSARSSVVAVSPCLSWLARAADESWVDDSVCAWSFLAMSSVVEGALSPPALVSLMLAARLGGAVTPPMAGRPSASREDLHVLYFESGNRSLTSSIDMSFFSRLLRWGRGICARSMGSPFSLTARMARFRWL